MRTPPDVRQLLERRAARLAQQPTQETVMETVEVVTVTVSRRRYALGVRHVSQILRTGDLCRLPDENGELLGLMMVGGAAVPVADLGSLLMLSQPDRTRPFVVLLGEADLPLGVLVDEVESFGQVAEMALMGETSPAHEQSGHDEAMSGDAASLEHGVTADGVVLLDAAALLAHPRAVAARTLRTRADQARSTVPAPPSNQENQCQDSP